MEYVLDGIAAWPTTSPFTTRAAPIRLLTARLRIWFTLPRCPSSRQRNVHPAELHLNAALSVQLLGATAFSSYSNGLTQQPDSCGMK